MMTSKDLAYISDIFNWNLVASKKISLYLNECDDMDIISKLEELKSMHETNCERMLKLLESEVNNG